MVCGNLGEKSHVLLAVGVISMLMMQSAQAESDISRLQDVVNPAKNEALLAQESSVTVIQVTGVQANPTETGVEVILQTPQGEQLQITNRSAENNFIADIPNAQLLLPNGDAFTFTSQNPVEGITEISVINLDDKTIRVTVTGAASVPVVELFDSPEEGLIFTVTSVVTSTQQQQETSQQLEQPSNEAQESIELVVTATRTAENVQNVPRSITVITREQIEQQRAVTRDLGTILSNTVPGLGPTLESQQSFSQTLRGRPPLVLIDGVPVSSNIDNDTSVAKLRRIDTAAIERIEVVRGPSAIYGDGATGGVINIITRRPIQDRVVSEAEIGVRSVGNFKSGSFGNLINYGISGRQGDVDFTASFTRDSYGQAFDAEGDRIPLIADSEADSVSINVLGKLGFDLGSQQRLQVTANYFNDDQSQNLERIAIPGIPKAQARDRPIEFIDSTNPFNRGTVIQLDYTHNDILNSQLQAQAYYRQTTTVAPLFDFRVFSPDSPLGVSRSVVTSERFGGRLQLDTALSNSINLLWGADYSHEDSQGDYQVFDVDEFDSSGGRRARKIGSAIRIAPFNIENLGVFSQLKWDASENLIFSGGVRYDTFNVKVIDNWVDGRSGLSFQGGEKTLDDVVFNVGLVYKATPQISLFTNFAQGFSLPNISRIVQNPREGFNFAQDVELSAPQKVDSYELGIRGQWQNFQTSLVGFYSYSSLGTTLQFQDVNSPLRLLRAPQRNYGIELTVDWQPSDKWKLGSSLTWSEGEREDSATGQFVALSGFDTSPLKLTAYLENETLPGWNNRLQALFVGTRDRAFQADIDPVGIDSYYVVDLLSSLELGNGTLSLGVRNLLNNQYLNFSNQILAGFDQSIAPASRGRTFTLNYRWSW